MSRVKIRSFCSKVWWRAFVSWSMEPPTHEIMKMIQSCSCSLVILLLGHSYLVSYCNLWLVSKHQSMAIVLTYSYMSASFARCSRLMKSVSEERDELQTHSYMGSVMSHYAVALTHARILQYVGRNMWAVLKYNIVRVVHKPCGSS